MGQPKFKHWDRNAWPLHEAQLPGACLLPPHNGCTAHRSDLQSTRPALWLGYRCDPHCLLHSLTRATGVQRGRVRHAQRFLEPSTCRSHIVRKAGPGYVPTRVVRTPGACLASLVAHVESSRDLCWGKSKHGTLRLQLILPYTTSRTCMAPVPAIQLHSSHPTSPCVPPLSAT